MSQSRPPSHRSPKRTAVSPRRGYGRRAPAAARGRTATRVTPRSGQPAPLHPAPPQRPGVTPAPHPLRARRPGSARPAPLHPPRRRRRSKLPPSATAAAPPRPAPRVPSNGCGGTASPRRALCRPAARGAAEPAALRQSTAKHALCPDPSQAIGVSKAVFILFRQLPGICGSFPRIVDAN